MTASSRAWTRLGVNLEEIVAHRLVYRPHVEGPHVEPVERRTAVQHLDRLIGQGLVTEIEHRRFRAT